MRKLAIVLAAVFAVVSINALAQEKKAEKSKRSGPPSQVTDNDPGAQGKGKAAAKAGGEKSKRGPLPQQATDNDPGATGKGKAAKK